VQGGGEGHFGFALRSSTRFTFRFIKDDDKY